MEDAERTGLVTNLMWRGWDELRTRMKSGREGAGLGTSDEIYLEQGTSQGARDV